MVMLTMMVRGGVVGENYNDFDENNINGSLTRSIKDNSPFTKFFNDVLSKVKVELSEIEDEESEEEPIIHFAPDLIDHLMDRLMPYIFRGFGT